MSDYKPLNRTQLIEWLMEQAKPWQARYMELGSVTADGLNALQQFTNYVNAAEMLERDRDDIHYLNEALLRAKGQ